nr:hypothetical protein CFP56_39420 [Quercus suber]
MEMEGSLKKKIAMQTLGSKTIPNPFSFSNLTTEWFTNQSPSYGVELKTHIETTDQRRRRSCDQSVLNLGLEKLGLVDMDFGFCMNMGFGFFSHESERTKDNEREISLESTHSHKHFSLPNAFSFSRLHYPIRTLNQT